MKARLSIALVVGCVACAGARYDRTDGPTVALPARFAEGSEQDAGPTEPSAAPPTELDAAPPHAPDPHGGPPDPPALAERRQWEMVVQYDKGRLRVARTTLKVFPRPVPTVRRVGRWAIELWIGRELIERVRFDFPLLGGEAPPGPRRPLHEPPTLAAGATVERTLLVPDSPRATRAVLVDRATGEHIELPWPPNAPLASPPPAAKTAPNPTKVDPSSTPDPAAP